MRMSMMNIGRVNTASTVVYTVLCRARFASPPSSAAIAPFVAAAGVPKCANIAANMVGVKLISPAPASAAAAPINMTGARIRRHTQLNTRLFVLTLPFISKSISPPIFSSATVDVMLPTEDSAE